MPYFTVMLSGNSLHITDTQYYAHKLNEIMSYYGTQCRHAVKSYILAMKPKKRFKVVISGERKSDRCALKVYCLEHERCFQIILPPNFCPLVWLWCALKKLASIMQHNKLPIKPKIMLTYWPQPTGCVAVSYIAVSYG